MVIFITLVAIIVVAFFVLSRKEKSPNTQNNGLNTSIIDDKNIKIVHVTDIHYLSPSLTDYGKSFVETIEKSDGKMMRYIDQIMDAFVLEMIRTKPDLVIVSGDMTYNGEKESHIGLANKFKILKDKGIKVLVLPGNHDLENEMALAFEGHTTRPVETVTIEEFEEIYKDYGYGKDDPDVVSRDKKSLNYVYQLGNKCHLIMVETSTKGNDQTISNSSYRWIEKWLRKAKDMNMRVIGVSHQNILAHNKLFIAGYKITNSSRLVDLYNKYNVRINLSGHMHIQHMAEHKRVHDIALACLGLYPNLYGVLDMDLRNNMTYHTESLDVAYWMKKYKHQDSDFSDFENTSREYFVRCTRLQTEKQLAKLDLSKEDKEMMMDFMVDTNIHYFSGSLDKRPDLSLDNPAYKLWMDHCERTFTGSYLNSIYTDTISDHNRLEIFQ